MRDQFRAMFGVLASPRETLRHLPAEKIHWFSFFLCAYLLILSVFQLALLKNPFLLSVLEPWEVPALVFGLLILVYVPGHFTLALVVKMLGRMFGKSLSIRKVFNLITANLIVATFYCVVFRYPAHRFLGMDIHTTGWTLLESLVSLYGGLLLLLGFLVSPDQRDSGSRQLRLSS